jgi:hypothetical protein
VRDRVGPGFVMAWKGELESHLLTGPLSLVS